MVWCTAPFSTVFDSNNHERHFSTLFSVPDLHFIWVLFTAFSCDTLLTFALHNRKLPFAVYFFFSLVVVSIFGSLFPASKVISFFTFAVVCQFSLSYYYLHLRGFIHPLPKSYVSYLYFFFIFFLLVGFSLYHCFGFGSLCFFVSFGSFIHMIFVQCGKQLMSHRFLAT